ncbi:hypothetical protein PR202_gb04424 [Eleusine coracana subsp. coracana]|uniref:Tyrosine--tRNA ligase n=1 Tax=Eleusine coracana subsp. coracana TaxID=191504 RepID=A0AAV5E2W5_ELECO|nr:hypothetical protein PR202_gb04424 [Eleusine coracana subsp. coracana]
MNSDERFAILRSIGEECIYEDELRLLLKKKLDPICYVWFEPSPMMDIEQGIMKTRYVNELVKAGCTVKILMADWFLQRHPKIGNNLHDIRTIGHYNIAMWKAAGMYLEKVELIWLSDELNHHGVDYWMLALDVSRKYTMKKNGQVYLFLHYSRFFFKCFPFSFNTQTCFFYHRYCEYMSPYGPQKLPAAEIFYPCMQLAVILCQKVGFSITYTIFF